MRNSYSSKYLPFFSFSLMGLVGSGLVFKFPAEELSQKGATGLTNLIIVGATSHGLYRDIRNLKKYVPGTTYLRQKYVAGIS